MVSELPYNNKKSVCTITLNNIGLFLFYVYIFFSYIANDVLLPSSVGSSTLYLFLGYSLVYTIFIKKKIKLNITIGWMALFMLLSLLSMIYSPEKHVFSGTFYFLIVNIILVMFLSQYTITIETFKKIGWVYSISSAILVVLLIATGNIIDTSAEGRLGQELLGNANIFATILMVAAIYGIWLLFYCRNTLLRKVLLAICLIADYFAMFLSGGRKYIIIPLVFLYILLLFKQDKRGRKHIIKHTVIIAAFITLVWYLIMKVPMFYNTIGYRMEGFISLLKGNTTMADGSARIRERMIEIGIEKWLGSPIYGYGFDSFKYYNQSVTGRFYYSHNNFIEMLYNTGVVGFVLYYWYYLYTMIKAWNEQKKEMLPIRAFAIALILSMFVYEWGAINYTSTSMMVLLCLVNIVLDDYNNKLCGKTEAEKR